MINLFKAPYKRWFTATFLVGALLILPIVAVVFTALTGKVTAWEHIQQTLLGEYIGNTLFLVTGVILLAGLLGLVSAFLVVFVDFPFKKFFEWALVLPLSVPAYLMAFSYAEIVGYEGWTTHLLGLQINLMNRFGAVFIFSLALFPYVYLPLKTFFYRTGFSILETAASLRQGPVKAFFTLLFPLCRPVLFGGTFLAVTEVLNDFGVVKYFGVPTFTVGIFRAWTGFTDLTSALRLASLLLLFVFGVYWLEKWLGRNKRFSSGKGNPSKIYFNQTGIQIFAFTWCFLLFAFSFLLPISEMLSGVIATASRVMDEAFLEAFWHSCQLALFTATLVMFLALVIEFCVRLRRASSWAKLPAQLAGMGYYIPGGVIALGVLAPLTGWDKFVYRLTEGTAFMLSSTITGLIYALVLRYMAVGLQSINSGYKTISPNLLDASLSLGASPWKTLFTVDFKVLRNFMVTGFILVFVDVIKELPLTLILRPFNFDTLATKAFNLASDELLREAANASILIVLAGMIPVIFLNRFVKDASA